MDQNQTVLSPVPLHSSDSQKRVSNILIILCLIGNALLFSIAGYQFGFIKGMQQIKPVARSNSTNKKIMAMPKNITPTDATKATPYTLTYNIPSGWSIKLWHPTQTSTANAIVSPDYSSDNDPNPKTGLAIAMYRYPVPVHNLQELKARTEETEDGLQSLTQTTIAQLPAYHAIFISTDSNRVLDDYHIIKNTDHWVIRIASYGNSLTAMQEEEQQYNAQITAFLQSIQFQ